LRAAAGFFMAFSAPFFSFATCTHPQQTLHADMSEMF
jgi:hypothetical protein